MVGTGAAGWLDGTGTNAAVNKARGIVFDSSTNIGYIADRSNQRIRRLVPSRGAHGYLFVSAKTSNRVHWNTIHK
jgi:hypothetical protein